MLWRAYIALHAIVVAFALAIGTTWVLRMRWGIDRWQSVATFAALLAASAVVSYLWMRTSTTKQLSMRAWKALRVELLALGAAAAFFAITDVTSLFSAGTSPAVPDTTVTARVLRVVDGDTIVVEIDGMQDRVRYIGMDTPETVHPTRGVEPYGIEASSRNKELVEGKRVRLEKDVSERDQHDRLLRYVWLPDGRMVNMVLVEEGFARVYTWPPDVRYKEEFVRLERDARDHNRGLWAFASD